MDRPRIKLSEADDNDVLRDYIHKCWEYMTFLESQQPKEKTGLSVEEYHKEWSKTTHLFENKHQEVIAFAKAFASTLSPKPSSPLLSEKDKGMFQIFMHNGINDLAEAKFEAEKRDLLHALTNKLSSFMNLLSSLSTQETKPEEQREWREGDENNSKVVKNISEGSGDYWFRNDGCMFRRCKNGKMRKLKPKVRKVVSFNLGMGKKGEQKTVMLSLLMNKYFPTPR